MDANQVNSWHHPLLDEEGRALAEELRRFAFEELSDRTTLRSRDRAGEFWREGWERCSARGLCGLPAPGEYGGRGASRVATAAALEMLGYGCPDAGLVFSLNAHLWSSVVPLWRFGDEGQREAYLTRLCRGEWIGLHAMTEPDSGSDAFNLRTTASREGDGYLLRGRKTLITNASVASVYIVFARSPESEGAFGVSAFLIERGAEGVEVAPPMEKVGLRTSPLGELTLDGVRVGPESLLGRQGRGGRVFEASMEWERLLIMSAQIGAMRRSLEEAVEYARGMRSTPSGTQLLSDRLVDIDVELSAARALLYETAWLYDHGERGPARAAAVKLLAAETVLRSALELPNVGAGTGYDTDLPFERRLRDAVGAPLYSGTSQMMRRIVARSMGL